jgi:hypothetical protein
MRGIYFSSAVCLFAIQLIGCPKRGSGEIDVDEIQSHVDAVEKHLKGMRVALKAKDLEEAEDQYEEAVEVLEDEAAQLAAYPEIHEIEARVDEAGSDLCYGFVNITLERFFIAIREKKVEESRSRLARANEELKRCQEKIQGREDYFALKMNIDSAPKVLDELEQELARGVLVERVRSIEAEISPRLQSIRADLLKLRKNPNQKELSIEERRELADLPEWVAFAAKITGELEELAKKRAGLVRRGKILWTVRELLPRASRETTQAVAAKNRALALTRVQEAVTIYRQCEQLVTDFLKQEPDLARFKFRWRGSKKTVAWLQTHCRANLKITRRMAAKLGGKVKIKIKKAKPAAPKPVEKKPEAPKKKKKKKKKTKRRGRIRRW